MRRLGEEPLLAVDPERRPGQPHRVQAAPGHVAARALRPVSPVGASRPMPCAVPPLTTSEVAVARGAAAAVAEHVAALERVDVEHGRGDPQRVAVAEPQVGADPGPDREVGVRRAEGGQLVGGEVADPDGAGRELGGDQSVSSRSTSARWPPEASGRCSATPSSAAAAELLREPPTARWAVMPCRRIDVSSSSTNRASGCASSRPARSSGRLTVWTTRRPRAAVGHGVEGPPRREHEQVAGVAVGDLGQLLVGADRERVEPGPVSQPLALRASRPRAKP